MKNDWIQTVSGKVFRPLAPEQATINAFDIAHALSHACRFAGHVRQFYSVAQHSVHVFREVQERCEHEGVSRDVAIELQFAALMHDASEAYCVDIPKPIKLMPELAGYREIEKRVEAAVQQRFSIAAEHAHHPWIKWADLRVLATEARDLLATPDQKWSVREEPMQRTIRPISVEHARKAFLSAYALLQNSRGHWLCNGCGMPAVRAGETPCPECLNAKPTTETAR